MSLLDLFSKDRLRRAGSSRRTGPSTSPLQPQVPPTVGVLARGGAFTPHEQSPPEGLDPSNCLSSYFPLGTQVFFSLLCFFLLYLLSLADLNSEMFFLFGRYEVGNASISLEGD